MATKSKLVKAVEERASALNDAQREIVMSQLGVYKRNEARLAKAEAELNLVNARGTATLQELRAKQAQRATLVHEIKELSTANSLISAEILKFMEG